MHHVHNVQKSKLHYVHDANIHYVHDVLYYSYKVNKAPLQREHNV